MNKEIKKSLCWGFFNTFIAAVAIVIGSRNLSHFDAALVGYTFATLFSVFAITYRYVMWLQRPPTALYWKRGWELAFEKGRILSNIKYLLRRVLFIIGGNSFIWKRGKERGLGHWLIMWGCILAAAITFPLVFGWVYFLVPDGDFSAYKIVLFGFPFIDFKLETTLASLLFHGLVVSAFLVIPGVMLAFRRRLTRKDAFVLQSFSEDILPLLLLFAISITGLFLSISYTWLKGYGFTFLSIFHAATVIFTLLCLPFGKFFHIFMRPAQFGVSLYKKIGEEKPAKCFRCKEDFSSEMQVRDLITVQKQLGYKYEIDGDLEHYQNICPRCRRIGFAVAQGRLWKKDHL